MPRSASPPPRRELFPPRPAKRSGAGRGWPERSEGRVRGSTFNANAVALALLLPLTRLAPYGARHPLPASRGEGTDRVRRPTDGLLLPRRRQRDPGALPHAAMAGFRECDIANAGREVARKRRAGRHMPQERFPSYAVGVAIGRERRRLRPCLAIVSADVFHHAEMGDRRRVRHRLHVASVQARNRRALGPVDLQREKVVAAHARRPRAQDGAEGAALELDQRRSRIVDRDVIALAPLVDARGRSDPLARRHPHDAPDDPLDDVAPVRIHIEDDAAAAGAVIPARPLAGLLAAVEHPPAELELESPDAPELAAPRQRGKLLQPGKMDLVLDYAVLHAAPARRPQQAQPLRSGRGYWLFAIDVLAGGERLFQHGDAPLRCGRVEEDRVGGIRERRVEIDGPIRELVGARHGGEAAAVAAREQQTRDQSVIADRKAAFNNDRDQGVGQMLGRADAAGRSVDNDADRVARHRAIPFSPRKVRRGVLLNALAAAQHLSVVQKTSVLDRAVGAAIPRHAAWGLRAYRRAPLRLGAGYVGLSPLVELVDELEEVCQQRGFVVGPTTHDDRRGNFRLIENEVFDVFPTEPA